ncbi:hypothetical protein TNIN_355931 [Trichonephila inaurata madagascariensis]|uniref:Uncharacterized protein n=1 Tax=Trichonephila inaurata madagascariensis TaxID=2747483 RepID=A0A8X6WZ64_9ARAC|nr:hypothetical protein TNIN_355931 [Trichonephila inaurata madagascariensis]
MELKTYASPREPLTQQDFSFHRSDGLKKDSMDGDNLLEAVIIGPYTTLDDTKDIVEKVDVLKGHRECNLFTAKQREIVK